MGREITLQRSETTPGDPGETITADAASLLLCLGPGALDFTRAQASAEQQGRHGDLFAAGYWHRIERALQDCINRGQG